MRNETIKNRIWDKDRAEDLWEEIISGYCIFKKKELYLRERKEINFILTILI